jgi:hypothetical protein
VDEMELAGQDSSVGTRAQCHDEPPHDWTSGIQRSMPCSIKSPVLSQANSASPTPKTVESGCKWLGHQPAPAITGAFRWAAAIPPSLGASP